MPPLHTQFLPKAQRPRPPLALQVPGEAKRWAEEADGEAAVEAGVVAVNAVGCQKPVCKPTHRCTSPRPPKHTAVRLRR